MGTKRKVVLGIRKIELKFLGCIIRKDGLENLKLTGCTGGKRDI